MQRDLRRHLPKYFKYGFTLKTELEQNGRKLRLMWHFTNDERSFVADRFRPKSSFNPRAKDAIVKTYHSCLKERLIDIEIIVAA